MLNVVPSVVENLPNNLLEAMACAAPALLLMPEESVMRRAYENRIFGTI